MFNAPKCIRENFKQQKKSTTLGDLPATPKSSVRNIVCKMISNSIRLAPLSSEACVLLRVVIFTRAR